MCEHPETAKYRYFRAGRGHWDRVCRMCKRDQQKVRDLVRRRRRIPPVPPVIYQELARKKW